MGDAFDNCMEYTNFKDQELMNSFEIRKNNGFFSSTCKKSNTGSELDDVIQPFQTGKRQVQKRNFENGVGRWPNGVVRYKLKPGDFSENSVRIIKGAMREISDKTCITFQEEVFSKAVNFSEWVSLGPDIILRPYSSHECAAQIGRTGYLQMLYLTERRCITHGVVMHEIMHALGMRHEHERPDRDLNIKILWENISPRYSDLYQKSENTDARGPYDISSLMHYGLRAGAHPFKSGNVMQPLYNRLGFLVGNRKYMTFYDAKKINLEYCWARCYGSSLNCQNEGYVDHRCLCACPRGLTGRTCNSVDTDYDCGGIIDVSTEAKFITTPRYPLSYQLGKKCTWLIKTVTGKRIRLELINMDLPSSSTSGNCYHWVEVKSHLLGQTGLRICGNYANSMMDTTPHGVKNRMLLIFDSHTVTTKWAGQGLKMRLSTIW